MSRLYSRVNGRQRPKRYGQSRILGIKPAMLEQDACWAMIARLSQMEREDWGKLSDEALTKIIGTLNTNGE